LRAVALIAALGAVACMSLAMVGMVTGRPGDRAGMWLRIATVALFGVVVAAGLAAH
jgi:hypothetical protein